MIRRPALLIAAGALALLGGAAALRSAPDNDADADARQMAEARARLARRLYENAERLATVAPPVGADRGQVQVLTQPPIVVQYDELARWSEHWMMAERDARPGKVGEVAALQDHVDRLKKWSDAIDKM